MILTNDLKSETIEALADLWGNKNFKTLVEVLRSTQDRWAKLCLTRSTWEEVQKLQWQASGLSIVIKLVEEAAKKLNGEKL